VVGALDIAYACLFWGIKANVSVERIFQSIAAGILGKSSFDGGAPTAALGLGLHLLIATSMATAYYIAGRRWPLLWQRPILCGAIYGLLLYCFMNFVVLPLSAAGPASRNQLWVALSIIVHMFLIGVPIAVLTRPRPRL
jgi:hypothetical protein